MPASDRRRRGQDRHYDEVPQGDGSVGSLAALRHGELALSADPLPPPPLPVRPPCGPRSEASDAEEPAVAPDLRPVRRFVPESWKRFFRGRRRRDPDWDRPASDIRYISDGVECSPPASPGWPGPQRPDGGGSWGPGPGGGVDPRAGVGAPCPADPGSALGRPALAARAYREEVEAYHLRYAYMKSWAGLLRILGGAELLLGAAVFACVTAYVHKDSEWYNQFGYAQPYGVAGLGGLGSAYSGYYYSGPKTPFVLVVAGLAWIATVIVLVLGMSLYYRTILLDSSWWPLTEFGINVSLFVLYMAAAIVYVDDTNRGGLCSYPAFNTVMNILFCRVESGQVAAIVFLFVTMIVYLIGALVCLKLWRHEAARRHREYLEQQEISEPSFPSKRRVCETAAGGDRQRDHEVNFQELRGPQMKPDVLSGHIPPGHIPKPVVLPDYVAKYPVIQTDDERERYKAVFQDQFSEYKELSAEVQAILRKLDELDAVMSRLPHRSEHHQEHERISRIHEEFKRKKNDPTFLEKKERCDYLKNKLSHIKQRIQEYDKVMNWDIQGYR